MALNLFIVSVLIFNQLIIINADFKEPFFEVTDDKRVAIESWLGEELILSYEENIYDKEFIVGHFLVDDGDEPFLANSLFFEISKMNFVSKGPLDYEKPEQRVLHHIIVNGQSTRKITIKVKNLNDNPIYVIQSEECNLEEKSTPQKLNCYFTLLDGDGLMDQFYIENFFPYEENFKFYWRNGVPKDDVTEAIVDIQTLLPFDYQKTKLVVFDWIVKDELFNATTKVVITIIDIPDLPPIWEKIFPSAQFDEELNMQFEIKAIDGDIGIMDDINYKWKIITPELEKYINFSENDSTLIINVNGIDRDEFQIDVYKFDVTGCEKHMPEECITSNITFIVNDINDNSPEISVTNDKMKILENTFQKLDTQIVIYDKDMGENAKYTVSLNSTIKNIENIFQIIPNSGYQKGQFSISVVEKEELDFDCCPEMRNFKFGILATETLPNAPHQEYQIIEIELINWNDEVPVFKKDSYEIEIEETIGRLAEETLNIDDLYAEDKDVGDCVTYKLIGDAINKILQFEGDVKNCEPNTPSTLITLKTRKAVSNKVQLFDFETQPEVIVQLEAQDNFIDNANLPHKTIAPIVIKLIDVNDETPVILNNQPLVNITEGQTDGTEIQNIDIIASDDDKSADLEFDINWEKSYISKNGKISKNWGKHTECIRITTEPIPNSNNKRAKFFIRETVLNNTPDFETFDTMYLYITVTDKDQHYGNTSSEVSLVITVDDINDETPEFINSTLKEKKVKDKSASDTIIGIITAIDADIDDKITYSLKERNGTLKDLVKIDPESGELLVNKNKGIDADIPTHYLYYDVTASDGIHEISENIFIKVDDINDRYPEFVEELKEQKVPEESKIGFHVLDIIAKDIDRDKPHNIISYYIKGNNVQEFFEVNKDGKITVKNDKLDRDEGQSVFDVVVEMRDNEGNGDGESLLTIDNFKIIITDINNKKPEIITKELKTDEHITEGYKIGEIKAFDKDEQGTDNARIDFELLDVTAVTGKEITKEFFNLLEYDADAGIAILKADAKLRGYYGTYNLHIKVTDRGINKLDSTGNVILIIDKYNFEVPKFLFPKQGETIYIKPNQELDKPLLMFNSKPLNPITATDQQGDKYNINFFIIDKDSIFKVDNRENLNTGTLKLKTHEDKNKYDVNIMALDDGNPSYNTTITFSVRFIDDTTKPIYEKNEFSIKFKETEEGVGTTFETPKATLYLGEEIQDLLPIYYNIYKDPNQAFSINSKTGVLKVTKPLHIVDKPQLYLQIAASTYESGESNPDQQSILKVDIELIDVNDHEPEFTQEIYYGAIMTTYDQQRVIISTYAIDLDPDDTLKYSINEETFEAHGQEISKNNKFVLYPVNNYQCDIKLGFQVQSNMKGYFTFEMTVDDSLHTGKTRIKINIIEERNLVKFIFENTINEIVAKQDIICKVFKKYLYLDCAVDSVVESSLQTRISELKSDVIVHFINEDNEPVDNNEIKIMMNDVETNSNVRLALRNESLFLYTIDNELQINENNEEILKAWLIGVTVVLGSICILLIVAFILKTRSLNKRLNKLTVVDCISQEDLSKITAAPTTNRRAIDGANPIYNIDSDETKKKYDRMSVSSGESDLIGVENNPVFY